MSDSRLELSPERRAQLAAALEAHLHAPPVRLPRTPTGLEWSTRAVTLWQQAEAPREPMRSVQIELREAILEMEDQAVALGQAEAEPLQRAARELLAAMRDEDRSVVGVLRHDADRVTCPHSGVDPALPLRAWADRLEAAIAAIGALVVPPEDPART